MDTRKGGFKPCGLNLMEVLSASFKALRIPVDPAGDSGYQASAKPCKSNAALLRGGLLSNTRLTYPQDWDNPGKLGLIPDRCILLE